MTQPLHVKRRCKFRWLLVGIYLAALLLYLSLLVLDVGHMPRGFDFLFYLLMAPCYLLDLVMPGTAKDHVVLALIICISLGIITYALIGTATDLIVGRIRRSKS